MRHSILKRTLALSCAAVMTAGLTLTNSLALGAGTPVHTSTLNISDSIRFVNTISTHTAGRQTSFALEYTPGTGDGFQLVTYNSNPIYGNQTISNAAKELTARGYYVVGGVNADFFYNGLPLGILIENGRLVSSANGAPTLAFRADGSAFVSNGALTLYMTNDTNGETVRIHHYNKMRQDGYLYLLSSEFAGDNKANVEGRNVLFELVDATLDDITVSCAVKLRVSDVRTESTATAIPAGQLLLTANKNCPYYDELLKFNVGDEVTLNVACNDEALREAAYATGCGDILVQDGAVTDASAWDASIAKRNPRTAVGIKADGTVVLYELDGRSSSYSNGLTLADLADEFVSQGCVTAVNLDGGGSSAMLMRMPDKENYAVVSKPSDGAERKCSTYIFLVTAQPGDGTARRLYFEKNDPVVLAGATVSLGALYARDSGYRPVSVPGDVSYTLEGAGTMTAAGAYTAPAEAAAAVAKVYSPSTGAAGDADITVVTDVADVTVTRKDTGKTVTSLTLDHGESVSLVPVVTARGQTCLSSPDVFTYTVTGTVGTITEEGVFTASEVGGKGSITVSGGGATKTVSVTVSEDRTVPEITLDCDANGAITAVLSDNSGITFGPEQVSLTVDGVSTAFSLAENRLTANADLTAPGIHRITVDAADGADNRARKSVDVRTTGAVIHYSDVGPDNWAVDYIDYLTGRGVVTGSDDGTFSPGGDMTRAAFCTMLGRYLGVNPGDYGDTELPFLDSGDIPAWAENYVKAMYAQGYISGRTDFYGQLVFCPDEAITRGEIFTLLGRLCGSGYENGCTVTFKDDEDIADWARSGVNTAAAIGLVSGYEDGTIRTGANASRAEVAKLLYSMY